MYNMYGLMKNIEEQCGGILIADIYTKIFGNNVLNSFDEYLFQFFSQIFVKYLQK